MAQSPRSVGRRLVGRIGRSRLAIFLAILGPGIARFLFGIGKIANLCFSWELYGSEGKALKAAKRFRDSLLPLLEVAGKNYSGNLASSRNTSGNVGITAEIMEGRYPCYSAQWTDKNGKRVKKSFSVTKWGEEKARQLAIEAREHGTGMYPSEVLKEIAELKEKVKKKQTKMKAQSATRD